MSIQSTLDPPAPASSQRRPCRHLRSTMHSGIVVGEGLRILGRCTLLGRDAYDRDCDTCPQWRETR